MNVCFGKIGTNNVQTNQEFFEVSFFKNKIIIPECKYHLVRLFLCPINDSTRRQQIDYYVELVDYVQSPVQYHDIAIGRDFYGKPEYFEKDGHFANNVIRFASGMAGLQYRRC